MSDQFSIRLCGVGKMYKVYPSRLDNFLDALGLAHFMPWRQIRASEFWALRDVDLKLATGSRLGIIGRNGAGKTTLLKLITGNLPVTEGQIQVNGQVQALLEAGAGFHPEFTGYENIRAALIYQGLTSQEIEAAIKDIEEFTELGQFLSQPFKTFSSGMQARLVFATATTLKPDILIIDEILGAGDAYFATKSAERMRKLVEESGASVLLVAHAMDQILRYCDECIWIERGRVVMRGPSLEVVKAYEEFIHKLEDRRLLAKNKKRHSAGYNAVQIDGYSDAMVLAFQIQGEPGSRCDIAEITLLKDNQVEETLRVGDVQDASGSHMAAISLNGSDWSEPYKSEDGFYRSLTIHSESINGTTGEAVFYVYTLFDHANYAYRVRYRCPSLAQLMLTITRNGKLLHNQVELPTGQSGWVEWLLSLEGLHSQPTLPKPNGALKNIETAAQTLSNMEANENSEAGNRSITRWPGEGSLTIEDVYLLGADGYEQAVFPVGSQLNLNVTILAHRDGHFNLVPSVALYRLDGILISKFPGQQPVSLDLRSGETKDLYLELDSLNLGDGYYVFSVALFEECIDARYRYDLLDRSYEFQVVGNNPLFAEAVFRHSGGWK